MRKILISLLCLIGAILLGLGIGAASFYSYYVPRTAEEAPFSLKDNGLTGASMSALLTPVQQDPRIADVCSEVTGSVVTLIVESESPYSDAMSLGSGVIYREDDASFFVITNAHVLEDSTRVYLYTPGDDMILLRAGQKDRDLDLAVVRIPKKSLPAAVLESLHPARLGDSDALRAGDTVIALGSPQDIIYQNSATVGIVSHPLREVDFGSESRGSESGSSGKGSTSRTYIQTDAAINPGNSGGGLFTIDGELVGINSNKFVLTNLEGLGFAIPINRAMEAIRKME